MDAYGKKIVDFTDDEKKLHLMDLMLTTMVVMENSLIGRCLNHQKEFVTRMMFAGTKLLNLPTPNTQEEFDALCDKVEESQYSSGKFARDFTIGYEEFKLKHEEITEEPKG